MITRFSKIKTKRTIAGYLFISPVIIGMLVFSLTPLLDSLYTSFTEYANIGKHVWVGLDNYKELFQMDLFGKALGNTMKYAFISIPLNMLLALALLVAIFATRLLEIFAVPEGTDIPVIAPVAAFTI